jgi:hypothetical protein
MPRNSKTTKPKQKKTTLMHLQPCDSFSRSLPKRVKVPAQQCTGASKTDTVHTCDLMIDDY